MSHPSTDGVTAYWDEALGSALESIGKFEALTREERLEVARSLVVSAENQSMAFGYDCIPNPKDSEIAALKARHQREIDELLTDIDAYRASVARRRGVDITDVRLENNRVIYAVR